MTATGMKLMRQSKLKVLHLDLLALSSSLEFLAPLDPFHN